MTSNYNSSVSNSYTNCNSTLLHPGGLNSVKLQYLTNSNVLSLIKEGSFDQLPPEIIICHFDNIYKFYLWHQNQIKVKEEKEKHKLTDQILADWSVNTNIDHYFATESIFNNLLDSNEIFNLK